MLLSRSKAVSLLLTIVLVPALACSDSTEPENSDTAQDFSGAYTLVSISQGTAAGVIELPGATGSMTLTATNYDAMLTVPQPPLPDLSIDDEGTYSATGSTTSGTWSQQSSVDVNLQYAGTYSYDTGADQLTLDTTASGFRTVLVLQKN